jgi:hypothetical protein
MLALASSIAYRVSKVGGPSPSRIAEAQAMPIAVIGPTSVMTKRFTCFSTKTFRFWAFTPAYNGKTNPLLYEGPQTLRFIPEASDSLVLFEHRFDVLERILKNLVLMEYFCPC